MRILSLSSNYQKPLLFIHRKIFQPKNFPSFMETLRLWLHRLLSFYLSITFIISHYILSAYTLPTKISEHFQIFVPLMDFILSLYFHFLDLSPCTIDLDDQTALHFWTTNYRRYNRPNLVLIHGCGCVSRWQFVYQAGALSKSFNLYIPDLVFYGKSYTKRSERSIEFQAECVFEGLKKLGVEKCCVYSISYGGFVGYRMAENFPAMVEKLVVMSSGIGCTEEQRDELISKLGKNALDTFVPAKPSDLRNLVKLSIYKFDPCKWAPDFFVQEFITWFFKNYKKEKQELLEHLFSRTTDCHLPNLTQETLLIWGDKDNIFPPFLADQLQRQLGPKSKLAIIPNTGHAANMESPAAVNELIKSFVLSASK